MQHRCLASTVKLDCLEAFFKLKKYNKKYFQTLKFRYCSFLNKTKMNTICKKIKKTRLLIFKKGNLIYDYLTLKKPTSDFILKKTYKKFESLVLNFLSREARNIHVLKSLEIKEDINHNELGYLKRFPHIKNLYVKMLMIGYQKFLRFQHRFRFENANVNLITPELFREKRPDIIPEILKDTTKKIFFSIDLTKFLKYHEIFHRPWEVIDPMTFFHKTKSVKINYKGFDMCDKLIIKSIEMMTSLKSLTAIFPGDIQSVSKLPEIKINKELKSLTFDYGALGEFPTLLKKYNDQLITLSELCFLSISIDEKYFQNELFDFSNFKNLKQIIFKITESAAFLVRKTKKTVCQNFRIKPFLLNFSNLTSLRKIFLDLGSMSPSDYSDLSDISMPSIEAFKLRMMKQENLISDDYKLLAKMFTRFPNLNTLHFTVGSNQSDDMSLIFVANQFSRLTKLQNLHLCFKCEKFSPFIVGELYKMVVELRRLRKFMLKIEDQFTSMLDLSRIFHYLDNKNSLSFVKIFSTTSHYEKGNFGSFIFDPFYG